MNSKYSQEQKLAAVQAYIKGEGGIRQIARDYQVSRGALVQWVAYYKQKYIYEYKYYNQYCFSS